MKHEDATALLGKTVAMRPHGSPMLWVGRVRAVCDRPVLLLERENGETQMLPLDLIKDWMSADDQSS